MRRKEEFTNHGLSLSGVLELPESGIRCYALFAHCFTCGKDVAAAPCVCMLIAKRCRWSTLWLTCSIAATIPRIANTVIVNTEKLKRWNAGLV